MKSHVSREEMIDLARGVFDSEAEAVSHLKEMVSDVFLEALNTVFESKGRLIICGMGKSGHIGKKIAATLASTGTPSFFMHPGEAYHGDLGMLVDDDIIMLISNSGETEEIIKLIPTMKNRSIPIISITSNPNSSLARLSDFHLHIDVKEEACLLGLAPTTSTTATLAMGDAFSICLMRMRNFQPENFAMFHPGGSLGRKLLTKVRDIMTDKNLPIVKSDSEFTDIVSVMTKGRLGVCLVIDDDELKGIITDGDLRRALMKSDKSRFDFCAYEIMTPNPKIVDADENASTIETMMVDAKINELVVVENGLTVGIVQLYDIGKI